MPEAVAVAGMIHRMLKNEAQVICVDNEDLGMVLWGIWEKGAAVTGKGDSPHEAMCEALPKVQQVS